MIIVLALVGIVGAFILGLLVGRKNPQVSAEAAKFAEKAREL